MKRLSRVVTEVEKIKTRAGDRLKMLRALLGMTQMEMAKLLETDLARYKNIEHKKVKVNENEFECAGRQLPELLHYIVYEGETSLSSLQSSQKPLVRLIAAKINTGRLSNSDLPVNLTQ